MGLKISNDDDAVVDDDDFDNVPSATSAATMTASNHSDVTLDVNEIYVTDDDDDDDDASLTFAPATATTACDNSVVLFISDDGDAPLSNIFKPHIEETEMEETPFHRRNFGTKLVICVSQKFENNVRYNASVEKNLDTLTRKTPYI